MVHTGSRGFMQIFHCLPGPKQDSLPVAWLSQGSVQQQKIKNPYKARLKLSLPLENPKSVYTAKHLWCLLQSNWQHKTHGFIGH